MDGNNAEIRGNFESGFRGWGNATPEGAESIVESNENDRPTETVNTNVDNQQITMNSTVLNQLLTTMNVLLKANAPSHSAVSVAPDLSKVLTTFDGDREVNNAQSWLESVRTSARLHNWSDAVTIETARAHLTGAATYWYQIRAAEIHTWQDFSECFRKTYIQTQRLSDKWERMKNRNQRKGESIQGFFHEKVLLCQQLKLNISETKEEIIMGLWHREKASGLLVKDHSNFDELLTDILSIMRCAEGNPRHMYSQPSRTGQPSTFYHSAKSEVKTNSSSDGNKAISSYQAV